MKGPIRTAITKPGQRYVDDPVYSGTRAKPLAHSIATLFGRRMPAEVRILEHYERTPLNWRKPKKD